MTINKTTLILSKFLLKKMKKSSILHVKPKNYKEAMLYRGDLFTAWLRLGRPTDIESVSFYLQKFYISLML